MNDMATIRGMGDGEAIPATFVAHLVTAPLPRHHFSLYKGACGITLTTAEYPGEVWRIVIGCLCLDDNLTRALVLDWLLERPGVEELLAHFPGNFEQFIEPEGWARTGSVKGAPAYRRLFTPYDEERLKLRGKDHSLAGIALCEQAKRDAEKFAVPRMMENEDHYDPKDPPRILFTKRLPNMHIDVASGLIA